VRPYVAGLKQTEVECELTISGVKLNVAGMDSTIAAADLVVVHKDWTIVHKTRAFPTRNRT
jgi:hypothetical protein